MLALLLQELEGLHEEVVMVVELPLVASQVVRGLEEVGDDDS